MFPLFLFFFFYSCPTSISKYNDARHIVLSFCEMMGLGWPGGRGTWLVWWRRVLIMSCPSNVCLFCCCCCFGPAQLPQTGRASMSVVEVDDPQLIILLHFMTPFMAIQPVFESPLARPASLQGSMASQLLIDLLRDRPGAHGMLLVSIEQDGKLQFLVSLSLSQLRFPLLISAASSYVVAESISYSLLPFSLPLFLAKRERERERERETEVA